MWEVEDRGLIFVSHLDFNDGGGSFSVVFQELLINTWVFNFCFNTMVVLLLKIHFL